MGLGFDSPLQILRMNEGAAFNGLVTIGERIK
jgi:hypothetical protein